MPGFADLVPQAQPALFGGGVTAAATAGRTWLFEFVDVVDALGDPIDLDTGVTGVCEIVSTPGGSVVATLDFNGFADGSFTISLDEDDTAGLPPSTQGAANHWSLILDDGTDSVQVWGVTDSKFIIKRGA